MAWSVKPAIRKDAVKKDGTAAIILRVRVDRRNKKDIQLGISVRLDQFNTVTGQVIGHANARDYNLLIGQAQARANEIFVEYRLSGRELSIDTFWHDYTHPEARHDFLAFYKAEMMRRWSRSLITDSTRTVDNGTLNKLYHFREWWMKENKLPAERSICFSDIDLRFMQDFDFWLLRDLKKKRGAMLVDNGNGSRWKAFKSLKCYLNIALKERGIDVNSSALMFKSPRPTEKKLALTKDQLNQLRELIASEALEDHFDLVAKMFVFSCLTGLRISDARRLQWSQIEDGVLKVVPHKTRNRKQTIVRVPLCKEAVEVLPEQDDRKLVWNSPCDQVINRHLKKIGKRLGWNLKLTFKVSRDTFGTLFIEFGGTVEVLQALLGHSKIQQTMKYVTIHEERKLDQMKGFDQLAQ